MEKEDAMMKQVELKPKKVVRKAVEGRNKKGCYVQLLKKFLWRFGLILIISNQILAGSPEI
jgi:hypothetical protein